MILNASQPRVTNWWFGFMIKQKCPSIYLNKLGPGYEKTYFLTVAQLCGCEMTNVVHMVSGQLGETMARRQETPTHQPSLPVTQGHRELSRIRKNEQAADGCRKMTPGNYTDQMSIPVLTWSGGKLHLTRYVSRKMRENKNMRFNFMI